MLQGAGFAISLVVIAIIYKFEVLDVLKDKFQDAVRSENSLSHAFYCEPDEIDYVFDNVDSVMRQFGSKRVSKNDLVKGYWNVLWSHDYINAVPFDFSKLKSNQKVNHIPGIYHLISKSHLATNTESKYLPQAFLSAVEVMETYANSYIINKNPAKRYVKKSKSNGDIQIKTVFEMNFENEDEFSGYFAQEYIENPLLIHGHKFEFSVDVLIASINPLRVYYYDKNVELLFTKKPYDSSSGADVDSYIIGESRISAANFPAFKKYFNQSLNYKEALNAELKKQKINVQTVWDQVDDAIRTITSDKEQFFINEINYYKLPQGSQNFFELVRFDFLLDNSGNLHIMEVNMSPNLYAGADLVESLDTYENIVENVLNIIGFGDNAKRPVDSDLAINSEICANKCQETCELKECQSCVKCMSKQNKESFLKAYGEQLNVGEFRRVVPPSNKIIRRFTAEDWEKMTDENIIHHLWFLEMCKKNRRFC